MQSSGVTSVRRFRNGSLAGRITLDDEWYMGSAGKELVAFGRKPADMIRLHSKESTR
jgi:hypothetical protein